MDDPGKVKSVKMPFGYIGIAWFEELDQFDGAEQIRNVEQSCLRGGNWSITFKSFNPPAMARNWANGYALQPRKGKLVHHSTYKTTPAEWLGEQITASVTSYILQGKVIGKIADDLQSRMRDMSRASAIRTARTAVTAAENAGRLDTYRAAQDMGIKLKKQWVATLDNRTRHAHAVADGQTVDVEKPFIIDGYKLMKPGDESAPGYLVYNCRCTTIADLPDVPKSRHELRRAIDPETGRSVLVPYMNYTQWASWKEAENRYAWETYMKKGRNSSSDKRQFAEYRKVLGDKVPDSVYKFQDLKYNDIEIWHALKTLKRQTMFVEKAQCETTERKFKEYLLKPGAKHAKEFFDVGYAKEKPIQLRYDIAKQYDESKVQNVIELEDGSKKYSIPMKLGITEKKQFLTCWIKEPGNGKPRITTAYRKDADK